MSPLQQRLRWWSESLGWAGVGAIALLIYGVATYTLAMIPAQQQLAQLEQEKIAEQQSLIQQSRSSAAVEPQSAGESGFAADFPRQHDIANTLNRLYAAARGAHITLRRGNYKLKRDSNSQFLRYEIELPVVGRYPAIQGFAYRALKEIPALALDEISFRRETASDALLQAKLHFTLYLRER